MPKEKDWIDYANLGSNLLQNVQLSGVQDKLGAMASVAASEEAKAAHEDSLRELVFRADTNLKGLRAQLDDDKAKVLVLARFTLAQFKQHNLTSTKFRSFEDKERLRAVLEGFKALAGECESKLSADERAEALLCARFMENPDVKVTPPEELTQQLHKAQQELSELTATEKICSSSSSESEGSLGGVGMGLLFGLLLCVGGGVEASIMVAGIGLSLCVLFGIALVAQRVAAVKHENDPQTRKNFDGAAEATRLKPAKEEEIKSIEQTIKNEVTTQRIILEQARDALMSKVLKALPSKEFEAAERSAKDRLETGEGVAHPGATSGVWVFGPGLLAEGMPFGDLTHMLSSLQRYGLYQPQLHVDDSVDELIREGFTIIGKKNSGETQVFAKKLPLVPPHVAEEVMEFLGIEGDTPVVYKRRVGDSTGSTITLQYLL
jgi:hypothetical protein